MGLAACLAAALLGASPVHVARVAVVAFDAPADLRYSGKLAADAVAIEAAGSGLFQVVGPEAVERQLGREGTGALSRCADDARCLAERGAALGVDRVVGGFLALAGTSYRVVVVHADTKEAREVARFERHVPIASRRLEADVAAAARALLRGEPDRTGRLSVVTDEPGLTVVLDGATIGTTPVTREVRPGTHQVKVSGDGYTRSDPVWVEVTPGEDVVHRPRVYQVPPRELSRKPRPTSQVEVVK